MTCFIHFPATLLLYPVFLPPLHDILSIVDTHSCCTNTATGHNVTPLQGLHTLACINGGDTYLHTPEVDRMAYYVSDVSHSSVTNLSRAERCMRSLLLPSSDTWPPFALIRSQTCDHGSSRGRLHGGQSQSYRMLYNNFVTVHNQYFRCFFLLICLIFYIREWNSHAARCDIIFTSSLCEQMKLLNLKLRTEKKLDCQLQGGCYTSVIRK